MSEINGPDQHESADDASAENPDVVTGTDDSQQSVAPEDTGEFVATPTVSTDIPKHSPLPPSYSVSGAAAPKATVVQEGLGAKLVIALIVASLIGGIVGAAIIKATDSKSTTSKAVANNVSTQVLSTSDIKSVLKKVEPAVVAINTNSVGVGRLGAGSGMILSEAGEVLTNAHVVQGGNSYTVSLSDNPGKEIPADLVGMDRGQDMALLKIRNTDNHKYPTVTLGSSDAMEVGDPVIAIGNALALAGSLSVTTGIVSAEHRSIDATDEKLSNLLQTDAAINPGNSGGPLVNLKAEVIGMNTAVADPSVAQNIGFAIAINTVKPQLADLRGGKNTVNQALLGVTPVTVTADLKSRYSFITVDKGAIAQDVQANSPASDMGLQRLDIITTFDGQAIDTAEDLVTAVRKHKPGDKVKVEWIRDGNKMSGEATLVARTAGEALQ